MPGNVEEVVRALSSAIAPVFLLTGIGSLVATANARYSRTIDRIRYLLREGDKLYCQNVPESYVKKEIQALVRRSKTLRLSLVLLAMSIFWVSSTILIIFSEIILGSIVIYLVEISFFLSILSLMAGVAYFIKDYAHSLKSIEEDISMREPGLKPRKLRIFFDETKLGRHFSREKQKNSQNPELHH